MLDILEIKKLRFAFIVVFSDLHNSLMQIPPLFLMFWTNTMSLDGDWLFPVLPLFKPIVLKKNKQNSGNRQMDL